MSDEEPVELFSSNRLATNVFRRNDATRHRRPAIRWYLRPVIASLISLAPVSYIYATLEFEDAGRCGPAATRWQQPPEAGPLDWAARIEYESLMRGERRFPGMPLTLKEYRTFGGIGAIVCRVDGRTSTSTAFLVGKFDLAVTVAHVFEVNGEWAQPEQCIYANAGPAGQIRERIPLAAIEAQWLAEPETYGHPDSDLAVVRLAAPVRLAMRTMSLTRFTHSHAPAVLVGYFSDPGIDALKRKTLGRVFRRPGKSCLAFTHDIDSRNLAPGAPIVDVRDNVVIGIHTRLWRTKRPVSTCGTRGNAMILMNSWLERTLRSEIESAPYSKAADDTRIMRHDTPASPLN